MVELITIVQEVIERGLLFGIVAAAVYLSSRLINFDNLSIEGAFGLGSAVAAVCAAYNVHPLIGLLAAIGAGSLSGIVIGLLNTQLKLNHLISGIVVTTGLFSIVLKMAGSNMTLAGKTTVFSLLNCCGSYQSFIALSLVTASLFAIISWVLHTEIGYLLQAVGDSPQMLVNIGKSVDHYIILGLMLSNACAALSGALFVQYTGYFSIWSSVGMLIVGLAGMIIAQSMSAHFGVALLIGATLYQALIALTFELQLDQDWNKLVTAVLIVFLIMAKQWVNARKGI